MFTGIVEEVGLVISVNRSSDGKELVIGCCTVLAGTATGDSISINGACQTVTSFDNNSFKVFASKVTLDITNLDHLNQGDFVNLERALTPEKRMGGHIVQGHVDFRSRVMSLKKDSNGIEILIQCDSAYTKYIVDKGSITVDGISLTVVEKGSGYFKLYVIPETIKGTNINLWHEGTIVNIEVDILAKYIESLLHDGKGEDGDSRLLSKLVENGFA